MTTVYDVPADILIARLTEYIKGNIKEVTPPEWAEYVKTGSHTERAPQNPDWWYIRSASILRKLYIKGPLGISRLRKEYGGRKRRGVKRPHFKRAGGAIIKHVLQQLEAAGLVARSNKKGRVISPKGRGLLDAIATQIKRDLERGMPELKVY